MVEWLLSNFGLLNNDKGKFFEYMARHERNIIKLCSRNVEHLKVNSFRKHDALLIFAKNDKLNLTKYFEPKKVVKVA